MRPCRSRLPTCRPAARIPGSPFPLLLPASRSCTPASHRSPMIGPRRIVCLTEEPTETLYALGESDRIVGISGFTVRPAIARKQKPKVSAFTSAKVEEILKLKPDFVVGFSDIQADIAAALIKRGVEVWISNHRSVDGIIDYVRRLGALVGVAGRANAYAEELLRGLDAVGTEAAGLALRAAGD